MHTQCFVGKEVCMFTCNWVPNPVSTACVFTYCYYTLLAPLTFTNDTSNIPLDFSGVLVQTGHWYTLILLHFSLPLFLLLLLLLLLNLLLRVYSVCGCGCVPTSLVGSILITVSENGNSVLKQQSHVKHTSFEWGVAMERSNANIY